MYAGFLETVANNPEAAKDIYSRAERVHKTQEGKGRASSGSHRTI